MRAAAEGGGARATPSQRLRTRHLGATLSGIDCSREGALSCAVPSSSHALLDVDRLRGIQVVRGATDTTSPLRTLLIWAPFLHLIRWNTPGVCAGHGRRHSTKCPDLGLPDSAHSLHRHIAAQASLSRHSTPTSFLSLLSCALSKR